MTQPFEFLEYSTREEWLALRRTGLGASDMPGVLGVSPYVTPLQVWTSKLVEMPDDDADEAMSWGSRLEPLILDTWESEDGRNAVIDRGALLRSVEHPWMLATLDGTTHVGTVDFETGPVALASFEKAVVEAKSTSEWGWEKVPEHIEIQVQSQLVVTGYRRAFVVALHGGRRLETYEVIADPDLQAQIIWAGSEFWKLVEAEEPPPMEAEDRAFLASLWPRSEEVAVELPVDVADELYEARRAYVAAQERKNAAEAAVMALMTQADTAVVGQDVVATWKTNEARRIDTSRLRAEMPDVARRFESVSTQRRFLVKGEA